MARDVNESATWYEATAARGPPRPPLTGSVEADVCVIGGGLAGLTAALELARRGKRVVLLEARRIAWSASGRNGGFVSNGFAEGIGAVAARIGLDAARALYRLSMHGTEYVRREIATGDPAIKTGDGTLSVWRHSDARAVRAWRNRLERDFGEALEWLPPERTRQRVDSGRYFDSLLNPRGFHIHPLRYALMIAGRAEAFGVSIHEDSEAIAVEAAGGGFRVKTRSGTVTARHVVHCTSAHDRRLHPPSARAVLPVTTYVAVTAPSNQTAIAPGPAYADTRRAGHYFRIVEGGRILWGGRITTRLSEPARLAELMMADMRAIFPQLGKAPIDHAWAGRMAYALHKMPLIGRAADGQWYATAFGGHGLNTTAMAGILLARAIADGDDEYRRFSAYPPVWAGGPLGRVGVQASYWRMRFGDWLRERRSAG